jgi:hypothetical protein
VLALLFDEEDMFGVHGEEVMSEELFSKLSGSVRGEKATKTRNRRHVRSNFEFFNNGAVGGGSDGLGAVSEGEMIMPSPNPGRRNIAFDRVAISRHEKLEDDSSPLSTLERRDRLTHDIDTPRVDSLADFHSALQAGTQDGTFDDDIHRGQSSENTAADSWIKAFGGLSGGTNRRWMTAPSPFLATIREDGDDDEQETVEEEKDGNQVGPLDQLSSEIRPSTTSVRQFRVPKRTKTPPINNTPKQAESFGSDPFSPSGEQLSFELTPPMLL